MTFKFRTVADSRPSDSECPRCGATMTTVTFSDGAEKTSCDVEPNHDGDVCSRVGHPEAWADAESCTLCAAPVTGWVRCEVSEGRAYTYVSFEDPALDRGEAVRLPGNVVQPDPFEGRVLRLLDGPDASYAGPYKAVMGRVAPRLSAADEDLL
jgi:hypothetical protein